MNRNRHAPWLTLCLIAANLLVAVAAVLQQLRGDDSLSNRLAFFAQRPEASAVFSSMFLHENLFHLLANMLFLAAIGTAVEASTGWLKYGFVYLVGGLFGVGAHYLAFRNVPMGAGLMGASASIAACIGFAGVRFSRIKVPVLPKVSVPAWALVVLWAGLQLTGMMMSPDSSGGVAFSAHLGGFGWGLLASVLLRAPDVARIEEAYHSIEKPIGRSLVAKKSAAEHILSAHPNDVKALQELAETERSLGDITAEKRVQIQIANVGSVHDRTVAILRLEEMRALTEIDATQLMKIAEHVEPEAKGAIWRSIALMPVGHPERPNALLALATIDPSGNWSQRLKEDYAMDPIIDIARAKGVL